MAEPPVNRHPIEYFGHVYTDHSIKARSDQSSQNCPFLDSECKKPRKSEPHIKVGVCTVGYRPEFLENHVPVVICPYRYHTEEVFDQIAKHYLTEVPDSLVRWAPEVSLGSAGSIDFVATLSHASTPAMIEDFICIEFQAAGTTGTPWDAVKEFQTSRTFSKRSYQFGINWANEFAKTMMQQVYKKGMVVESWKKRIVFVLQDVGMEYLRDSYDISGLHSPAKNEDPIHFFTMRMDWNDAQNMWMLVPSGTLSTNLEGIRKILGGSTSEGYITLATFLTNVVRRLS